jgi:hypothetical protein
MIPTTVTQVLITLVLVIPGFVYQEARTRLHGRKPSDAELTSRLLRAIAASTIFALLYVVILGPYLSDLKKGQAAALAHPRFSALLALLGAFAIPMLVAFLLDLPRTRDAWRHPFNSLRLMLSTYDPQPSAWDVAFARASKGFVRVRMKDGTWFAGYFGQNSYASSFPDPRSLFVEFEYSIDQNGAIGDPIEGSVGSVIECTDAVLIELLSPVDASEASVGAQ